jgi:hypothetical protein
MTPTTPEWVVCFPDVQLVEEGSSNHPYGEPSLGDSARAARPGALGAAGHDEGMVAPRSLPVRPLGVED